jgi:hypothetical protein
MVTHITKITGGNYNRRENPAIQRTAESLTITTCRPGDGQCPIKEFEERIVNDVAHRRHKSS